MSLSTSFTIHKSQLLDRRLGAIHHLESPGDILVQQLQSGITLQDLRSRTRDTDDASLYDLLGFLNLTGALRRQRSWSGWRQAFVQDVMGLLTGVRHPRLIIRKGASPWSILTGLCVAITPVVVAIILVGLCAAAGGLLSTHESAYTVIATSSVLLVTAYSHELGHYIALQHFNAPPDVVRQRLRLGLLHRQLHSPEELVAAIAGPAGGMATCFAVALLGICYGACVVVWSAVFASAIHLLSALPWYGDGASMRRALKEWRTP